MSDREDLAALVRELAVVHGKVTLSSGKEADYYVDLRRATLHHKAAPLIGSLLRELVADWDFDAVGGATFTATATRTGGRYNGNTLTLDDTFNGTTYGGTHPLNN